MKTIYISFLSLLVILSITSCKNGSSTDSKDQSAANSSLAQDPQEKGGEIELTEAQMKAVNIELGKIEKRELNNIIRVNGVMDLDPQKKAEVTSLQGGIVTQILVIEGKPVSKGQTVAYLENTGIVELQKNYLITKKETLVANQEYQRQKDLSAQGAGIEKNLQQAFANYEIAKAQLTGLEKQLRQLSINPNAISTNGIVTQIPIKSPISGIVSKINVSTGSFIDIQNSLMSITDNSDIHCDVKVFEKDINKVKVGQEVDITLTNQPNVHLQGTIYEINKSFEGDTKAITVHVKITNKNDVNLIPGMYVTGLINTGKEKTDAIPNDALASIEGKKYIFVLDREMIEQGDKTYHFKKVEVIPGISELGYTQITLSSPLSSDATVVLSNAFYLASMATDHGEE